jgi:hypothetical protein
MSDARSNAIPTRRPYSALAKVEGGRVVRAPIGALLLAIWFDCAAFEGRVAGRART